MIIDLKDKFDELKKENEVKKNNQVEKKFSSEYFTLREELSDNNFCKLMNFKYVTLNIKGSMVEEELWNPIQCLAVDIYHNSNNEEKLDEIRSYISKICNSVEPISGEIHDYLLEALGPEYEEYFNILVLIESSMIKIANFRSKYVKEINNDLYVFTSYLDLLTTGDYLRLSLIEDFILSLGAFVKK